MDRGMSARNTRSIWTVVAAGLIGLQVRRQRERGDSWPWGKIELFSAASVKSMYCTTCFRMLRHPCPRTAGLAISPSSLLLPIIYGEEEEYTKITAL